MKYKNDTTILSGRTFEIQASGKHEACKGIWEIHIKCESENLQEKYHL